MLQKHIDYVAAILLVFLVSFVSVAQDDDEIKGVWQTAGYGWVFDIQEDHVVAYQVTDATCVVFAESEQVDYQGDSIHVFDLHFPGLLTLLFGSEPFDLEFELEGPDTFIFDDSAAMPIYASRLEGLPISCADGIEQSDDPREMFNIFWHMFAENYAFFDLYDVDWAAVYDNYSPIITDQTTLEELYGMFVEILQPFGDAHVNILSPYGFYSAAPIPEWTNNDDEDTIRDYILLVIENYLIDTPQIVANDNIIYGRLSEDVGYINILSMNEFGEDDDIAALDDVFPEIIAYFAEMDNVVVDVRFNGGGDDMNSLRIAGYFADDTYLAFSKQTWLRDHYSDLYDVYLTPAGEAQYSGDVYLLTSGSTTSAAEIFTMTMSALPNVTSVGEATAGALSDLLILTFPNGWFATLSNEQYVSNEGEVYEGVGVPADMPIAMSLQAMRDGFDPVLDTVLSVVK